MPKNCNPQTQQRSRFDTRDALFNSLEGWSNAEPEGRWTVGGIVEMPAMPGDLKQLCLVGHAYVPKPNSLISVSLVSSSEVAPLHFSSGATIQQCFSLKGNTEAIRLKIHGFSSPKEQENSEDNRQLGLFLRALVIE
jgi:hypothetical protein